MGSAGVALTALLCFSGISTTLDEADDYVERVVGKESLRLNAKDPSWKPEREEAAYPPLPVTSVAPGTGFSEPVTYEMYMKERARAEARSKDSYQAQREALLELSFSNSLRAMSSEPAPAPTPSFQIYAAKNASPAWTTAKSTELSYSDALKAMTSDSTTSSLISSMSASVDESFNMIRPFGTAYAPVIVKAGTFAMVESSAASSSSSSIPADEVARAPTIASDLLTKASDVFLTGLPAPVNLGLESETVQSTTTPAKKDLLRNEGTKTIAASHAMATGSKEKASLQKPVISFRVEGYRFKPEMQSAIAPTRDAMPYPLSTATADTIELVKTGIAENPTVPSSIHPVQGFKFQDTTKAFIQVAEWNKAAPNVVLAEEPIVSPSFARGVNVVSYGSETPMNAGPSGNAVSTPYQALGASYLEALSKSNGGPNNAFDETSTFSYEMAGAGTYRGAGGSYLESLSSSSNSRWQP